MIQLLRSLGTAFAAILSDRLVAAVWDMVQPAWDAADDANKAQIARVVASQGLAAVIHARYGLSGLATAYDYGIISVSDYAAYIVKGLSWRISPVSPEKIIDLENRARDNGFWAQSFTSLEQVTTDPASVASMYSFLLSSNNVID